MGGVVGWCGRKQYRLGFKNKIKFKTRLFKFQTRPIRDGYPKKHIPLSSLIINLLDQGFIKLKFDDNKLKF